MSYEQNNSLSSNGDYRQHTKRGAQLWDRAADRVCATTARANLEKVKEWGEQTVRTLRERAASDARRRKANELTVMDKLFPLLGALIRCPPSWSAVKHSATGMRGAMQDSVHRNVDSISTFAVDALVFVISRQWFDSIAGVWWKLHAQLYCGGTFLVTPCASEASSERQFMFALALIPIAGLIKHIVESVPVPGQKRPPAARDDPDHPTKKAGWCEQCLTAHRHHEVKKLVDITGFDQIPMMMKYLIGWAFAFATEQWLREFKADNPDLCPDGDCSYLDIGFCVALTFLAAILLLFIHPLTQKIEFGTGPLLDFIEDLLEDTWAMVARALSIVVMVQWYDTSVHVSYPSNPVVASEVGYRIFILWACTATWLGSLLTTWLESFECWLTRKAKEEAAQKKEEEAQNGQAKLPSPASSGHADEHEHKKPTYVDAVKQFSDLVQASLSWVAGCAWVDVIVATFPTLSGPPTPEGTAINMGVALLVLFLTIIWFALSDTHYSVGIAEDRDTVEKFFITNSLSFFVGWVWLVVVRNLFGYAELGDEKLLHWANIEYHLHVDESLADLIAVFVLCPLFTLLLFGGESALMHKIDDNWTQKKVELNQRKLKENRMDRRMRQIEEEALPLPGRLPPPRGGPYGAIAAPTKGVASFFANSSRKKRAQLALG